MKQLNFKVMPKGKADIAIIFENFFPDRLLDACFYEAGVNDSEVTKILSKFDPIYAAELLHQSAKPEVSFANVIANHSCIINGKGYLEIISAKEIFDKYFVFTKRVNEKGCEYFNHIPNVDAFLKHFREEVLKTVTKTSETTPAVKFDPTLDAFTVKGEYIRQLHKTSYNSFEKNLLKKVFPDVFVDNTPFCKIGSVLRRKSVPGNLYALFSMNGEIKLLNVTNDKFWGTEGERCIKLSEMNFNTATKFPDTPFERVITRTEFKRLIGAVNIDDFEVVDPRK